MEPLDRIEAKIDRLEEKLEKKLDAVLSMVTDQKADFAAHVATDTERFETIDETLDEHEGKIKDISAQHVTDLRKQVSDDSAEKKTSKWWIFGIVGTIIATVGSPWVAKSCGPQPTSHTVGE